MKYFSNFSIKRALIVYIFLSLLLFVSSVYSQTTEKFADHSDGDKSFSEGTLNFNVTSQLEVDYKAGWGFDDDYFISNFANPVYGGGTVGSFTNTTSDFKVHELYIIPLNTSKQIVKYNNILIRGKLDGGTQFTHTINYNEFNTTSTNNYFTYIDLSSYSSYTLDELEFIIEPYGTNNVIYLMIDDFQFEADASLPVELLSFSAIGKGNSVELQWTTASESDNLGFIIERKTDKSDWQKIASYQSDDRMAGQGTTSSPSDYSFTDANITAGADYSYRLFEVNINGDRNEIGTTSAKSTVPLTTQLFAAYPNPFNPTTMLKYQLAIDSHMTLAVYDILGRQIKMLADQHQAAGEYTIQWDGSTDSGVTAASGTYLVRMHTARYHQSQKIQLLK